MATGYRWSPGPIGLSVEDDRDLGQRSPIVLAVLCRKNVPARTCRGGHVRL